MVSPSFGAFSAVRFLAVSEAISAIRSRHRCIASGIACAFRRVRLVSIIAIPCRDRVIISPTTGKVVRLVGIGKASTTRVATAAAAHPKIKNNARMPALNSRCNSPSLRTDRPPALMLESISVIVGKMLAATKPRKVTSRFPAAPDKTPAGIDAPTTRAHKRLE